MASISQKGIDMKNHFFPYFLVVLCLLASSVISQAQSTSEVVFNLPIGRSGLTYENEVPEMLVQGPSAIAIGPDGTFWIANPVDHTLRQYNSSGNTLNIIHTSSLAVGLTDICVTEKGIFILDAAALRPRVLHLDFAGVVLAEYPSPVTLESGLSGISYTSEGGLILEQEGGAYLTQLIDPSGKITHITLAGYPYNGNLYRASRLEPRRDCCRGELKAGTRNIEVVTPNQLAGMQIFHVDAGGDVYVIVEEMISSPEIWVDRTVRRYNSDGQFLGLARVPLTQRYSEVPCDLAMGLDNKIYTILTLPDCIEVHRLSFSNHFVRKAILSGTISPEQIPVSGDTISRNGIIANARAYLDNSRYLNSTNISGSCSGRTKPDYLGNPGTYNSVPYDWGGWDTVSAFNSYMDSNYKAGDVNSDGIEFCSRGVDCAGFVTRALGRTDKKYGTSSWPSITKQLNSTNDLLKGDILNKAYSHVRLFASFANGGCNVYESTTGSYDRVIYRYLAWSSFSGYVPLRYLYISDNDPSPTPSVWPVHSTTSNNSGTNVYAIQYLLKQHGQSSSVDGSFGSGTKTCVQNVQSSYGLPSDGIVAESTWKVLIKTVSQGSTGDHVRAVQHLLKNKFGFNIAIDGDFGTNTKSAIVNFQTSKGLTVDGIVGPQTWLALVGE